MKLHNCMKEISIKARLVHKNLNSTNWKTWKLICSGFSDKRSCLNETEMFRRRWNTMTMQNWIENRMSQNSFQYEWHSSSTTTPRLTKKWITCLVTKSIHLVFKFSLLFTNIHFASHYLVTTLRNFTILLLPLAFLHHHTLYMIPLFRCLTCVIITLVLQTSSCSLYLFGVCLSGVVLPIFLDVVFLKIADPIISSGMTPAKKIIRTMELLTELNWWV